MLTISKITQITSTYKNLKRYKQIINVLLKYGFGGLIEILKLDEVTNFGKKILYLDNKDVIEKTPIQVRVRQVLEELGPTFVKLGQILATRPDLIPIKYVNELTKLQDNVPSFPYEQVESIILEETGKYPDDIFESFERKPLAAASIGQVHRACYQGHQVVVKVQRPGVRKIIEADLEIMYHLALIMEKHVLEINIQRPSAIVKEFSKSLSKEIDFENEMKYMMRFASDFTNDETIYVPEVYEDVSTKRIMVMEFIDGIKSSNLEVLKEKEYDLKLIAKRGVDSLVKQIFQNGFFHGDPHPGNILIMPNNVICFLDFGMMGKVSSDDKENFASLLMHIINKKPNKIIDTILKFAQYDEMPDTDILQRDITEIIDEYLMQPMKYIDFSKFIESLMEILANHRLRILPNIFLMMKALVSLETLGKSLDPELEVIQLASPYVKKIYLNRFNVKKLLLDMADPIHDVIKLAYEMPDDLRYIVKQIRKGKLKLELEYRGLDDMRNTFIKICNRIVFAMVLSALILGYSLFMLAPRSTTIHLFQLIGLIGFVFFGFIGLAFLLIIIMKRNK
jgi:ubiquinone biosynthesis protein